MPVRSSVSATETHIKGVFVLTFDHHEDERGYFARTFDACLYSELGIEANVDQASVSFNEKRGTLRGIHFQAHPFGETKTIRCSRGSVYHVAVDVREGSPTFGQHFSIVLNERELASVVHTPGIAHGFVALEDRTMVDYMISPEYEPSAGTGIRWNDPALAISWPITDGLTISDRDMELPLLSEIRPYAS